MIRFNLIHKSVGLSTFPLCESQSCCLPQGLHVVRGRLRKTSAGVLDYLGNLELRTLDPWERDDIRISWLTVLHCSELKKFSYLTDNAHVYGKRVGEIVWEYAFWMYFGKTYDKANAIWANRRQINELSALPPKKPSVSVEAERKAA